MPKSTRSPCPLLPRYAVLLIALAGMTSIQASEFNTRLAMQQSKANSYYISGTIEGLGEHNFLVDTGASYVTLAQDELDTLKSKGLAHYQRDITGRMADGTRKVVPIYRLASINIGGRCNLRDVEAAVLPGKSRKLLGLSALRKAGPFIFSMDPPEIVLSGCT